MNMKKINESLQIREEGNYSRRKIDG